MILISGEALIDLIPDPVRQRATTRCCGGSPYNVAIGLARLGAPTAFVSRLSADANGEALAAALSANGVDLSLVERDKRPTTLAFVMRGTAKTGSRYSFYLDATRFDGAWPFPAAWPEGRAICTSARSPPSTRGTASGWSRRCAARRRADDELRSQHPPAGDAGPRTRWRAGRAAGRARHIVKASEEDLEWLYPGRPIEETLSAWSTLGPRFCVATLGERGAVAISATSG